MKFKNLLGLSLALLCLFACKKNDSILEHPAIEKVDALENAKDSISYTIDGTIYNTAKFSSAYLTSNLQPNSKVDSIVKNIYYISGDQDSVLYAKTFSIHNDKLKVNVTFIKKYSKNVMRKALLWIPNDLSDLYKVGPRNYAIDFERNNSQNGIAISIADQKSYKTFGSDTFRTPPLLSADTHKESYFEIISLKKLTSGIYILEAKFNTTVFDNENHSKKLNNGYLRLRLDYLGLIL